MKHNWEKMESQQVSLKKIMARRKKGNDYFVNEPESGYMRDPLNGEMKKLVDCTDSTLNRFLGSLNSMYKAIEVSDNDRRGKIIRKKIEIEEILKRRENGGK